MRIQGVPYRIICILRYQVPLPKAPFEPPQGGGDAKGGLAESTVPPPAREPRAAHLRSRFPVGQRFLLVKLRSEEHSRYNGTIGEVMGHDVRHGTVRVLLHWPCHAAVFTPYSLCERQHANQQTNKLTCVV